MSIVAAKKAFQAGWGETGQVLSGTMHYKKVEVNGRFQQQETFVFKVKVHGETKQYQFTLAEGENWDKVLGLKGEIARNAYLSERKAS